MLSEVLSEAGVARILKKECRIPALMAAVLPILDMAQLFDQMEEIATPVEVNARKLAMTAISNNGNAMVWTEPDSENVAVKTAT